VFYVSVLSVETMRIEKIEIFNKQRLKAKVKNTNIQQVKDKKTLKCSDYLGNGEIIFF
jgi:hypothetical protein